MIDIDTFLTYLYVMVDDFCKQHPSCERHPGPSASLRGCVRRLWGRESA